MRLSRYQQKMTGAAWNGYMAGIHAAARDNSIRDARAQKDPAVRVIYARSARESHRYYLKSARAAFSGSAVQPAD